MSNQSQALAVVQPQALEVVPLSTNELIQRRRTIQNVMNEVMKEDVHYGKIPGVDKPMLFKAGADLLCNTFRLAPRYLITRIELGGGHREYEIVTNLTHAVTEQFWGSGLGSCSTMESKYRYRNAARVCPHCGKDSIIKGKTEYGGGWLCFKNKGGCGAKYSDSDASITEQQTGKVENPDISDQFNTILKMAKKRSLADAVITATGCADMFTATEDDEEEPQEAGRLKTESKSEQHSEFVSEGQLKTINSALTAFKVPQERLEQYLYETHKIEAITRIPSGKVNEIIMWVKSQKG
jgi:hypothetical protein